jgi:carboxypeptidase family protein
VIAALLLAAALHAPMRQVISLPRPGATAAYSIDPAVAEASVAGGQVSIDCRSAGTTTVTIVTAQGVETLEVTVDALAPNDFALPHAQPQQGFWLESIYDSGPQRWSNSIDVFSRSPNGLTRLRAVDVTQLDHVSPGDARSSLPFLSAEIDRGGRQLVLFDELVEQSPLTLDGVTLRGAHYAGDGLAIHAGYTSPLLYQGVLLASEPDAAAGASYTVGRWTPSLYWFPLDSRYGGTKGMLGTLAWEQGKPEDPFHIRAEAGWGRKPGGALDASFASATDKFTLSARYQPQGIASVGVGRPHGAFLDAAWSDHAFARLTTELSTSLARLELPSVSQRSESGTGEVRYLIGGGLSALAGATVGSFEVSGQRLDSVTVPVGFNWDTPRAGATALFRWQRNSASNTGGSGGRLSLRTTWQKLYAGAFGDYQKDAATVDLVFRDDPALAQAFAALGLDAQNPEDLARILRDNPQLAQLGYIEGATVNLHPWRLLTGADVAFLPNPGTQLRLHVQLDRRSTVARLDQTALANLSYVQRITPAVEAIAGISGWTRDGGVGRQQGWSALAGLRLTFDRLPSFGGGAVRGLVIGDDQRGIPGVRVRMDGGREALTDDRGEVEFSAGRGTHRLDAVLPPDAYFTTRSSIDVTAGERAQFGLSFSPARVSGLVRDDDGAGIGGVTVRLGAASSTTDSSGHFSFAVAQGVATLSVQAESLPPGYDLASAQPAELRLSSAAPQRMDFEISAERSISGVAPHGNQQIAVWIGGVPAAKTVAGVDGKFVLRHLKHGTARIAADIDGREVEQIIELPEGPAAIRGVVLK